MVDPLTVKLALATPLGGFLEAATQPIAPAHLLDGVSPDALPDDPFGTDPIGSGPFRLVVLDPGHALLRRRHADRPAAGGWGWPELLDARADRLPGDPAADEEARRGRALPVDLRAPLLRRSRHAPMAWDRGDLDAASGLQPADATALAGTPGARLVLYPSATLLAVTLNLRPGHPTFSDPAVRKALLQAIDRNQIVATTLDQLGVRADSLVPPSSPMFDPTANPPVPFDPAAARKAPRGGGLEGIGRELDPEGRQGSDLARPVQPRGGGQPGRLRGGGGGRRRLAWRSAWPSARCRCRRPS